MVRGMRAFLEPSIARRHPLHEFYQYLQQWVWRLYPSRIALAWMGIGRRYANDICHHQLDVKNTTTAGGKTMTLGAIIMMLFGLGITWGGATYCISVAMRKAKET